MRLLVMASLLAALLLGGLAVTAGATGFKHDQKTKLCHVTGSQTVQISVSNNAVSAHLRQGDSKPDEYGDCPGGGNGGDNGHDHGGGGGNDHNDDYWWQIRFWQWFFWQHFWSHFGHFSF
jgi:hypothetical protein